jgi:hypothetical protein
LADLGRSIKLTQKTYISIKDLDFIFENSPVSIIVNRSCPEIELAGIKVGPLEEGREYDVRYWVAHQLEETGVAYIKDEKFNIKKINNVHWKESSIVHARQLSSIDEKFYPKMRRYLSELRKGAITNPEKMREYEKVMLMSQDIVNCRLRKIVSLASSPEQTENVLKDLAQEERILYEGLRSIINEWKSKMLKLPD